MIISTLQLLIGCAVMKHTDLFKTLRDKLTHVRSKGIRSHIRRLLGMRPEDWSQVDWEFALKVTGSLF